MRSHTLGEVSTPSPSFGARVSASGCWEGAQLAPRGSAGLMIRDALVARHLGFRLRARSAHVMELGMIALAGQLSPQPAAPMREKGSEAPDHFQPWRQRSDFFQAQAKI